jgi:hypothetical protein
MTMDGRPTPACLAKQLFAQHVRLGDWVRFPTNRLDAPDLDAIVAWDDTGRRSAVFVNVASGPRELAISDWDDGLAASGEVLRVDTSTGDRVVRERFDGTVRFEGYGVAVVTNAATDID